MRLLRVILVLSATLSFLCPAHAQGQKGAAYRLLDRILDSSRALDPNAVYVPAPRWTLALTGDLRQARFSQKQDFSLPSAKLFFRISSSAYSIWLIRSLSVVMSNSYLVFLAA